MNILAPYVYDDTLKLGKELISIVAIPCINNWKNSYYITGTHFFILFEDASTDVRSGCTTKLKLKQSSTVV